MAFPMVSRGRLAQQAWRVFSTTTIAGAMIVLAIYVNAYDDDGITDRLRAIGAFVRQAMRVLSFPLGPALGVVADRPLEGAFGCGEPDGPCSVFVNWWTHFGALLAEILFVGWIVRRQDPRHAK